MAVNTVNRAERDHRLYVWFAILMPLIVLLGFARTYYLRGMFNGPAVPSLLVHLHGAVMTSWVLLFISQVWLVASRRTKLHMRLGIAGAVLASLVVIVGIVTGVAAAARGHTPGPPALQFLVIPIGDVLVFGALIGLALYFRRRLDIHKRLMLVAAVSLLTPAIARIPLSFIINGGPIAFFGLTDVCLITFLAIDTIKNRKLHPAFLWATVAVIVS
ncbi:MAG TPA: hypothetical protein VF251_06750, partial [Pyrinomonadaceae bacterium]